MLKICTIEIPEKELLELVEKWAAAKPELKKYDINDVEFGDEHNEFTLYVEGG